MNRNASRSLAREAMAVLRANDAGVFVKPAPRQYPGQWNWDAAFVAIGLAHLDPPRAREEVRALLSGQWADGMIPHIVFHLPEVDYFPGPAVWNSTAQAGSPALPTSGITQPPVLATAVRILHQQAPDRSFLAEVVPPLDAWHRWLHRARDFDGSGLVAILHPWESGTDNSPRFDHALEALAIEELPPFERRDRLHVDRSQRPTDLDYRRYIFLVDALRRSGYRPTSLREAPFAYLDVSFNSILAVAEQDLGALQGELGQDGTKARVRAEGLNIALQACWDGASALYRDRDLHGTEPGGDTVAGLMPLYAGIPDAARAQLMVEEALWASERFGSSERYPWAVTSVSKASPAFEPRRYWRGPVWVGLNWFLVRGMQRYGMHEHADRLRRLTLELVERSGFAEYYDPQTGAALGTGSFSWAAALTLDLLLGTP
jgi:glycogen debranching enzyme